MFPRNLRIVLLTTIVAGGVGLAVAPATAAHGHYGHRGERHGFAAETHMIHALEAMEKAYRARRAPALARLYANRALGVLRVASRDLDSNRAKQYLELGQIDVRTFILTGRYSELDHAAGHVADAIRAEQLLRARAKHVHRGRHGHGHVVRHGHGYGHGHGHGHGHGGVVVHPGGGWDRSPRPQTGGVFQIGGEWGGIRLRF
ncbi:MAG: hypothetical protein WD030_10485 [Pirellulales bacterium]